MTIKASWERLFGHGGDGEPPGRPVNWKVKLASMRAPVVLHEGEVRNHDVCSEEVDDRRCLKEGMRGRAWDEVKSYGAHFNRSG